MADAYKVLHDTSLPRPVRTATTAEGVEIEEVTGQAYRAGDYVLESELTAATREGIENGQYEDTLEEASTDDVEAARAAQIGVFIPEHEVERVAMIEQGKRVVEKDQLLDLRSAGAEGARQYLEESRDGPDDANDLLTAQLSFVEVSDITTSQNEDQPVLPGEGKQDEVSEEDLLTAQSSSVAGVEMPPGIPVGPVLAGAESGGEQTDAHEKVQEQAQKEEEVRARAPRRAASAAKPVPGSETGSAA